MGYVGHVVSKMWRELLGASRQLHQGLHGGVVEAKNRMAGYRDMRLYGTLYDGMALKRDLG